MVEREALGEREALVVGEAESEQVEGPLCPRVGQPHAQGVGAALPAGQKLPMGQSVALKEEKGQYEPPGHSTGAPEEQ